MTEVDNREELYLLRIPRFDLPEFGSLDEDYLCRKDQLAWYIGEEEQDLCPVEILGRSSVQAENLDYEYLDGDYREWNFWVRRADADCVYIALDESFYRCVKVRAEDVIMVRTTEEEATSVEAQRFAFRRLGEVSGFAGIVKLTEASEREWAAEKESLHNRMDSNIYYLEREFETEEEMRQDINCPAPAELRRFFEDILEQK